MNAIKNDIQYQAILKRVDQLTGIVGEHTSENSPEYIELDILVDLLNHYENERYPIGIPKLTDVIKLRMYEMNLSQKELAKKLGMSESRVSEYLNGKSEITLKLGRILRDTLSIDADIILNGVSELNYELPSGSLAK